MSDQRSELIYGFGGGRRRIKHLPSTSLEDKRRFDYGHAFPATLDYTCTSFARSCGVDSFGGSAAAAVLMFFHPGTYVFLFCFCRQRTAVSTQGRGPLVLCVCDVWD